jgi:hypothetical protein
MLVCALTLYVHFRSVCILELEGLKFAVGVKVCSRGYKRVGERLKKTPRRVSGKISRVAIDRERRLALLFYMSQEKAEDDGAMKIKVGPDCHLETASLLSPCGCVDLATIV